MSKYRSKVFTDFYLKGKKVHSPTTAVYKNEEGNWEYKFEGKGIVVTKPLVSKSIDALLISKRDKNIIEKQMMLTLKPFVEHEKLIIGIGTGRCGTYSLSALLASQPNIMAHHEFLRLLWKVSIPHFTVMMSKLFYDYIPRPYRIADVGLYFIQYIDLIRMLCPQTKFVCMQRDAEEVYNSFVVRDTDTSHWTNENSKHWDSKWKGNYVFRECYPHYDLPREEAIRKYIKDYHERSKQLQDKYPNSFRIFDVNDLNTKEGVISILDFIEVPKEEMNALVGIRVNVSNANKGE